MTFEIAKNAIDFLVDKYAPNASSYIVDLTGSGEPLLNIELIKQITHYCEERKNKIGKSIGICFCSNFTKLTPDMIDFIEKSVIIGTSLDGDKITNDNNRIYANGKGSYDDVVEKLKLFKNKKVGIAVTITPLNQNIDEIYASLYNLPNVDCISMKFIRSFDNSAYDFDNFDVVNLTKHYEKLCENILDNLADNNFDYLQKIIQGSDFFGAMMIDKLFRGVFITQVCDAGKNRIAVDSSGDIYACSVMVGEHVFKIGSINNPSIINNEEYKCLATYQSENCQDCIIKDMGCCGECYANSFLKHGDLFTPIDKLCEIKIELHKLSMALVEKIKANYQNQYEKLVDFAFRSQRYLRTDSSIWAISNFLKLKGIEVNFNYLNDNIRSDDYQINPVDVLTCLQKHIPNIGVYQVENINDDKLLKYPAIAFVGSGNYDGNTYLLVNSDKEDYNVTTMNSNKPIKISKKEFLLRYTNLFFAESF
ncbi:hypothetical protein AGMMS50284_7400 [Clostridia bacterium]|nr:hypothetical protein AGMMS50284_7400 [Clostridia bacterium]